MAGRTRLRRRWRRRCPRRQGGWPRAGTGACPCATAAPWLAVAAILVFRIAFSVSLGPVPYIVTSEVFPQKVRNVGVSAATAVQWIMNALVTFTFLRIREIWSAQGVWMLYFTVSVFALTVVYKVLPETTGKPLEA